MSGNAGSYSFRVRAEGFAEFVRDLQQVAGESAAAQRAIATLIQSSPQLASAMTAAAEATERAARAAVQQREAQAQAAAATAAVTTQVAAGAQGLQTLQDRTLAASRAVVGLQGALQMAGLGQFAAALGPVGTGLTTVASGMGSAAGFATRFGEAALSLSRYLPGIGVALGAIAVATIDWDAANDRVARSLQGLRGVMADSEAAQTAFERGIRGIIQALETAADRERRLAAESRERMIAQGAAELPTIEEQRNRARRRVEELQPIAEQVQLAREIGGPDTQIAGAAARRYADWQRAVAELQRLQALVDQAEGALRDLRSIPYGQPGVVPEPPLPTPPIPPQATGGGRTSATSDDEYARRMGERVQRAADEQARIEDRARDRAAEAEQRALRQREEANRRVTDDIVRYGADAFADLFDRNGRGWQGMLDSFERTFVRLMARLGAEAVIRPIVEPVVSYLGLGSIGSAVTGGAAGGGVLASAGGGTGTLGSLSNLWSLGSNVYSAFAGSTTGIAGLVNGFGAGSGLFAAGGSFGSSAALYGGAMNSGAAMAGQTAAAPLFGSTTAMGFLGAAGLGYGAGSLLGSYLAGDSRARQTNAQIGAAAGGLSGAALGAMYGSAIGPWGTVLGALIGGLAGGGGGGLIGPGPKTNAYGYTLDVTNGQFGAGGLMTTGTGNGGAEAIQETQRLVAALNQVMQGAGVSALPMRRVINGWANSLDQSASLNDAFALARFSAADARMQTAVGSRAFGSPEELAQTIQAAEQLIAVLDGLGKPMANFKDQAEALWQSFEPSIATAGRLGFGVAELRAEQQRQQDALWAQRNETLAGITSSLRANQLRAMGLTTEADLMDFDRGAASAVKALREQLEALGVTAEESAAQVAVLENTQALQRQSLLAAASAATPPDTTARDSEARQLLEALSFGGLGGLSGGARSAAARLALMEARQPLRDGATTTEMAEFSRVAAATLPVIRDVEGIGGGYRDIVRLVSSTLREAAPSNDTASLSALIEAQTAGADQITEAVLRIPGAIAELRGEFSRLALRLDAIAAKAA